MTLPSTCLPAEPTAAPSDLLAVCAAPAQSPGSAPLGTPFASLLTQAATVPAAPFPSIGVASNPVMYPGIYYMPPTGSTTAPSTATCAVPTLPVVPVPASGSEVLMAAVCPALETIGEKPKTLEKSEDVSGDEPDQVSMELVYQLVAGQWMPPPVLQVSLQVPASGECPIQKGLPGNEQKVALGAAVSVAPQSRAAESQPPQIASQEPASFRNTDTRTSANQTTAPAAPQSRTSETKIPPAANQTPIPEQPSAKNTLARVSTNLSLAAISVPSATSMPVLVEQPSLQPTVSPIGFDPLAAPRPAVPLASSTPSQPATPEGVSPVAQEQPDVEMATVALAEGAGIYAPNRRFTPSRPTQNQAPEKFAASITPDRPEITSGVNPSTGTEEKKSLFVDGKSVTATQGNVGTSTANREIAMSYSAVNKSPSVDFPTTLGAGLQPNNSTETKVDMTLAAHAPRLVQEIRAIADRLSVIDRNSVEVRFDFNDTDRLSVRVEYRDGTVHTTFKTDSSQLRDVVAHEWQSQNSSSEQRSYRMADPVFSQTVADRQNFSGANDSSGRQRAFEQQAQHGAPSFASSGRSAGSTTFVAAPAARSARPETSQHLHVLA